MVCKEKVKLVKAGAEVGELLVVICNYPIYSSLHMGMRGTWHSSRAVSAL